jgi:hypothetical protein
VAANREYINTFQSITRGVINAIHIPRRMIRPKKPRRHGIQEHIQLVQTWNSHQRRMIERVVINVITQHLTPLAGGCSVVVGIVIIRMMIGAVNLYREKGIIK